jgi:hypothetical protein
VSTVDNEATIVLRVQDNTTMLGPGLRVGTDQLAFRFYNGSQANWGCLDGIYVGGDPRASDRGVLASWGVSGASPVWQLTATSCNDSFPAASLVLQSCTAVCTKKYVVSMAAASAHLRWEGCTTPFLQRGTSEAATLDVDVTLSVVDAVSTWGATVGKKNAAGVCLQVSVSTCTLADPRDRTHEHERILQHRAPTSPSKRALTHSVITFGRFRIHAELYHSRLADSTRKRVRGARLPLHVWSSVKLQLGVSCRCCESVP